MLMKPFSELTPSLRSSSVENSPAIVATRRDFLGFIGGVAILAGLSPAERIIGDPTLTQPAAAPFMLPGTSPHIKGPTPFAVILCSFSDLPPLTIASSVFYDYVAGPGKGGVFDYWKDISYGNIDLTGSKVFGPYTMKYSFFKDGLYPETHKEGERARYALIKEAIRLATENPKSGFRRSDFYGVIAVVNADVDDSNDGASNLALGIMADWGQNNWRWCNKCEGLAYGGNPAGPCPAGTTHDFSTSSDYRLAINMPTFPGQNNWRWCKKCGGLAYAGNGPGPCPAGKAHDHSESADYRLAFGKVGFPGQNNWKWCNKCQGLAFAGDPKGLGSCPAGDNHTHVGSGDYTLVTPALSYENHLDTAFGAHEMGHCFGMQHAHCAGKAPKAEGGDYCDPWDLMGDNRTFNNSASRFGRSGSGLNAGNLSRLGWIPEDRIYTASGSRSRGETITLAALSQPEAKGYLMARIISPDRIFTVEYRQRTRWDRGLMGDAVVVHELRTPYTLGQNNWKWCGKCLGLAYAGFGAGPCPAGEVHDHSGSSDYGLVHDTSDFKGQNNWRWCNKCQGLAFAGAGEGNCPAGGVHDLSRSYDYLLLTDSSFPGQNNWRWCKKCKGLAFAGAPTSPGICPAGGKHDHSASGDYTLLNFGTDEPFLLRSITTGQRWADLFRGVGAVVDRIDTSAYAATVTI